MLAYPSGRIRDRVERWFVTATYVVSVLLPVSVLLCYDPAHGCLFNCSHANRVRPHSLVSLTGDHATFTVVHDIQQVAGYGVAGVLFIALIVRRYHMASPHVRRRLTPLLVAGAAAGMRAISEAVFGVISRSDLEGLVLFSVEEAVQIAVPIVLLLGILGERLDRASVADLVRELQATPPAEVATPVARALHDPTLEVAFWMPARRGYVDAEGRPYELPDPAPDVRSRRSPATASRSRRSSTTRHCSRNPSCSKACAPLRGCRSRTPVSTRSCRHSSSRCRSRGRGSLRPRTRSAAASNAISTTARSSGWSHSPSTCGLRSGRPTPPRRSCWPPRSTAFRPAVRELRELAHGVYPAILTQSGLAAALDELAARSSLPVTVHASVGRLPEDVEATGYFVACEALANTVKHRTRQRRRSTPCSQPARSRSRCPTTAAAVPIPTLPGLRGLADRVEARGGRLWLDSPAGGGTRVRAEIPCAS